MTHKIQEAIVYAANKHKDQYRKRQSNGISLPYITHPLEVLRRLWSWGTITESMAIAAVLHDVVEDTDAKIKDIETLFGEDVAAIVDDLTFISTGLVASDKDSYLASFENKPITSVICKIADRLCNVDDFSVHDLAYARNYYLKASSLFRTFVDRSVEADKMFNVTSSSNVYCAIHKYHWATF